MLSKTSVISLFLLLSLVFLATGKPVKSKGDCKLTRMACKEECKKHGLKWNKVLNLEKNVLECSCKDVDGTIKKFNVDWTSKPVEPVDHDHDHGEDITLDLAGENPTQFPNPDSCYIFRSKNSGVLVPSKLGLIDGQLQKYILDASVSQPGIESAWKFVNAGNGLYKIQNCKTNQLLAWTAFTYNLDPTVSYVFTIPAIPAVEKLLRNVWSVGTSGEWVYISDGPQSLYVTNILDNGEKLASVKRLELNDDSNLWKLEVFGAPKSEDNYEETHHEVTTQEPSMDYTDYTDYTDYGQSTIGSTLSTDYYYSIDGSTFSTDYDYSGTTTEEGHQEEGNQEEEHQEEEHQEEDHQEEEHQEDHQEEEHQEEEHQEEEHQEEEHQEEEDNEKTTTETHFLEVTIPPLPSQSEDNEVWDPWRQSANDWLAGF